MEEYRIMRFEEVMKYLDVGKNTLYDLLRSGKIKFYMEGKKYKIPQKSVEEYVKSRLT